MSRNSSAFRLSIRNKWASVALAGSLIGGLGLSCLPGWSAPYDNSAAGDPIAGQQELLNEQAALMQIARRVLPAVVQIESVLPSQRSRQRRNRGEQEMPMFPFGGDDMGPSPESGGGIATGSGVIIDPNGTIITNRHVVQGAKQVTVTLTNHQRYEGTVYSDPNIDLAVVEIHAPGPLPYVKLADSNDVQVGQWAIAIGYPFDVGETLSRGVISALGRSTTIEGQYYPNLIQTDASINPGNSGGALVNINGELIGINTAIAGAAGQSAGIGFAIPSATVNAVWPQLAGPTHKIANYPKGWVRGKLGVSVRPVTPDMDTMLGVNHGALVAEVQKDSPAAEAGLEAGDVITKVNDTNIEDADQLVQTMSNIGPHQTVTLTIVRNKNTITRTVTTGAFDQES